MPSFHTFEKINASFAAVVCHETIHIESTALRPTRESRAHLLCACCCAAKLGSWGESGVSTARGEGGEGGRACTEAELCGAKKGSKRSRSQHASLPLRRDSVQDENCAHAPASAAAGDHKGICKQKLDLAVKHWQRGPHCQWQCGSEGPTHWCQQ